MLILPVGDEDNLLRRPYVNYAFIAANVMVYLLFTVKLTNVELYSFALEWGTVPANLKLHTLLTAAFVHGGLLHLAGNMWFLGVFGDNVEDRIGHLLYPLFYIAGALCASLTHILFNEGSITPAVGASGAVSAVLGAYMVMMPRVKVKIFYWIYYRAGVFTISAVYVIGFWIALQVFYFLMLESERIGGVAYSAHIGGAVFGIAAGIIAALVLKSTRRGQMDELDLRKAQREFTSRQGLQTFESSYASHLKTGGVGITTSGPRERRASPSPLTHNYVSDAKEAVSILLETGKEEEAVDEYLSFIRKYRYASLLAMDQLRIADLLLTRGEHHLAEEAYDRFLRHYPEHKHSEDVRYNLAMLCAQYTENFQKAKKLLKLLRRTTSDSVRVAAIEEELERIEGHYARISPDIESPAVEKHADKENYVIFRQSGGKINIPEAGRIIAGAIKQPLADITTRLFTCSGFIADSLTRKQAEMITQELQKMNVSVFMLEQNKVIKLPEAVLAEDASFGPHGFKYRIEGQEETLPWDRIIVLNGGILESFRQKEVTLEPPGGGHGRRSALGFGPRKKKITMIRDVQKRLIIDVVAKEPWERLRIQEGYTTFALLGENLNPSLRQNFEFLAQEAVRYSTGTFIGDGLKALGMNDNMSNHVYDNRRKFDLANFWLLNRAIYDRPA